MLEDRPHRNVGALGDAHHGGGLAGLVDHGLGSLDDLATGFRRTPIAPVRSDHPAHFCHGVAARHYRCFAHFRIFLSGVTADGSQTPNPSPMEGVK